MGDTSTLSGRIRTARVDRELSIEKLAIIVNRSWRTVMRWERAESSPTTDDIYAIARATGVEPQWLIGEAPAEVAS